jgi:hypothetical protein
MRWLIAWLEIFAAPNGIFFSANGIFVASKKIFVASKEKKFFLDVLKKFSEDFFETSNATPRQQTSCQKMGEIMGGGVKKNCAAR